VAEHTFAGMRCSEVAELAPAFVLGALDAPASDAVRRHLAECPEAHAEMAELYSVVPALFEVVDPVAPPAGLKDRILAAAASDTERATAPERGVETPGPADSQLPGGAPAGAARPPVRVPTPGWTSTFRRTIWAPIALAAALAVAALGFWNLQLQQENAALVAYRQGVVDLIEAAAAPGAQVAVLAPTAGSGPSGVAAVAADGTVALVMRDLAPTTGTQVYEAWIIAGQAAPVPIGEFTVAAGGLGTFQADQPEARDGLVVAVSLEPGPDSTTPTTVVAAGQAQARQS
jgi:anti-sigma factor RsiW